MPRRQPKRKRERPEPTPEPRPEISSSPEPPPDSSSSPNDGRPEYMCDCHPSPYNGQHPQREYKICHRCLHHQHMRCSEDDGRFSGNYAHLQCNLCYLDLLQREVRQDIVKVQQWERKKEEKREEIDDMFRRVCWGYYCDLPNHSAPSAVRELTRTHRQNGRTVPVHPAPEAWVNELMQNVHEMNENVPMKLLIALNDEARIYAHERDRVLIPWREMALELIHRGPWQFERRRLGLVGELVGLFRVGFFAERWLHEEVGEDEFDVNGYDDDDGNDQDEDNEEGHDENDCCADDGKKGDEAGDEHEAAHDPDGRDDCVKHVDGERFDGGNVGGGGDEGVLASHDREDSHMPDALQDHKKEEEE